MRHYVRLQPEELRHRHGPVSARLVHHEAQPAPQREDGAAAGLRRCASAAAALDRAGRDCADRRAVALALGADRHAGDCHDAQGRRTRRAVRADGHQGGDRGARREAVGGAGARVGAWHQSGDGGAAGLSRRDGAGARGRQRRSGGGEASGCRRRWRRSCSPTPTPAGCSSATWWRLPTRCMRRAPSSTPTAPTSTPSSARCGRAISASMPCTSICTRRSRRRMAAAGRVRVRWRCRRRWRRSCRCRMRWPMPMAFATWSMRVPRAPTGPPPPRGEGLGVGGIPDGGGDEVLRSPPPYPSPTRGEGTPAARLEPNRSGACAPSMARWACTCGRWLT